MHIYLIRHAETDWNAQKRLMGRTDIPLNNKGMAEANKLANKIGDFQIDAIFSSPLSRALETAELIKGNRNTEVKLSKHLLERNFGSFEGMLHTEMNNRFANELIELKKLSILQRTDFSFHKEIETNRSIWNRFIEFTKELENSFDLNSNIMIVTHCGLIQAVLQMIEGGDKYADHRAKFHNLSIVELEYYGKRFEICQIEGVDLN